MTPKPIIQSIVQSVSTSYPLFDAKGPCRQGLATAMLVMGVAIAALAIGAIIWAALWGGPLTISTLVYFENGIVIASTSLTTAGKVILASSFLFIFSCTIMQLGSWMRAAVSIRVLGPSALKTFIKKLDQNIKIFNSITTDKAPDIVKAIEGTYNACRRNEEGVEDQFAKDFGRDLAFSVNTNKAIYRRKKTDLKSDRLLMPLKAEIVTERDKKWELVLQNAATQTSFNAISNCPGISAIFSCDDQNPDSFCIVEQARKLPAKIEIVRSNDGIEKIFVTAGMLLNIRNNNKQILKDALRVQLKHSIVYDEKSGKFKVSIERTLATRLKSLLTIKRLLPDKYLRDLSPRNGESKANDEA